MRNEAKGAEEIRVRISWFVKTNGLLCSRFHSMEKKQSCITEYSNTSVRPEIETLKEEFKPVVLEKHELQIKVEPELQILPAFLVSQDSHAEKNLIVFNPILLQKYEELIATLSEEIKPELLEKNEFKYRYLSKLIAFRHCTTHNVPTQFGNHILKYPYSTKNRKISERDLQPGNQVNTEKCEFEQQENIKSNISSLAFSN